jgi:hypothetical protein
MEISNKKILLYFLSLYKEKNFRELKKLSIERLYWELERLPVCKLKDRLKKNIEKLKKEYVDLDLSSYNLIKNGHTMKKFRSDFLSQKISPEISRTDLENKNILKLKDHNKNYSFSSPVELLKLDVLLVFIFLYMKSKTESSDILEFCGTEVLKFFNYTENQRNKKKIEKDFIELFNFAFLSKKEREKTIKLDRFIYSLEKKRGNIYIVKINNGVFHNLELKDTLLNFEELSSLWGKLEYLRNSRNSIYFYPLSFFLYNGIDNEEKVDYTGILPIKNETQIKFLALLNNLLMEFKKEGLITDYIFLKREKVLEVIIEKEKKISVFFELNPHVILKYEWDGVSR